MAAKADQQGSLRWGVVGTGWISSMVVPDLVSCPNVSVELIYSRDITKAQAFASGVSGARATNDYEQLLADPVVDIVYIATPISTHYELALQALSAGKHVLIEKPMAQTASEVEELFRTAGEKNLFLMEGMWTKFNPAFIRMTQEIASGTIGEPRSCRGMFGIPLPEENRSRWDVRLSGSTLLDQGIYPVTLGHVIFGPPDSVHAVGTVRPDGLDLAEHFTLEYSDGRFAQCATSMKEFADLSGAVNGTKGWIELPGPFWSTTSLRIHAGSWQNIIHDPTQVDLPREGNGYIPMLRAVSDAVRAGLVEHPVHSARDTIMVFRTLDQIQQAIGACR
ncbi:Gfo/Idh/MocA family oxidoreductase [Pseudarthrobacter sp. fls2-241-R2A-127]|uniref:Gfo/Idh/MocA family protein n=1 Tax=Pseudarthrobacter sp. fls2-241-R2A-127 TaxID=3040303 RepID=UPI002552C783|nr:Gfo/Idh/MocA family oxidoreductase [Pseudarthrobacter sp. fls2-241-R2A-127]